MSTPNEEIIMYAKVIAESAEGIISGLGKAIDDNVTSDEERLILRNEATNIVVGYKNAQMQLEREVNQQVTDRWKSDNESDSWLAKNVRPIVLLSLTATMIVMAIVSMTVSMSEQNVAAMQVAAGLISAVGMVAFGAYFGGRSIEKANQVRQAAKTITRAPSSMLENKDDTALVAAAKKKLFGGFVKAE